ncbi:MAG: Lcl C-terminal domain-containing protein [Planctomycetota bacterium]|jgi:hypothetical protein
MNTNVARAVLGVISAVCLWVTSGGCTPASSNTLSSSVNEGDACESCDDCCTPRDGSLELAATGQTTSYAEGDDGNYQHGEAQEDMVRFSDCGDGTIVDRRTGLMWLADASCMIGNYPDFETDGWADGHVPWNDALQFIAEINAGNREACAANYADWRLPNVLELESLVNAGAPDLTGWLMDQGFNLFEGNAYWTSTTYAGLTETFAFSVDFRYGSVSFRGNKGGVITSALPVRDICDEESTSLRATGQVETYAEGDDGATQAGVSAPDPRCTDNNDGTVTDNLTGLTWLQDAACQGGGNWEQALQAATNFNRNNQVATCENYTGTYTDWRIPNRRELMSLLDFSQDAPALAPDHPFLGVSDTSNYWSSTTYAPDANRAWIVDLSTGNVSYESKANRQGPTEPAEVAEGEHRLRAPT